MPFIAWWPGRIAPGTRTDHVSAFWDFPATALELAGIAAPDLAADGISYAPTLLGRGAVQRAHDFHYWEVLVKDEGRQAIRMGAWKAVRNGIDRPVELHDLASDPAESRDIAASHPEIVARVRMLFQAARTDSPEFPLMVPPRVGRPTEKKP